MKKHVVNRAGRKEVYEEKKVYASVYAAALNCEYGEREAEVIAKQIMQKVNAFVGKKSLVNSKEIRSAVLKHLKDRNVALMYKHYLDLS